MDMKLQTVPIVVTKNKSSIKNVKLLEERTYDRSNNYIFSKGNAEGIKIFAASGSLTSGRKDNEIAIFVHAPFPKMLIIEIIYLS